MTMTRYYLYIRCGVRLDTDTRFYKVACGDGIVGTRQRTWLVAYAAEHGHFFVLWSFAAAEFLLDCAHSIEGEVKPLIHCSAGDMINYLRGDDDDPALWQAYQHRHRLLMAIDPNYYAHYQISRL